MTDKRSLRKELLHIRDGIPENERRDNSVRIAQRICMTDEYRSAGLILTFLSVGSEVDTEPLIRRAFADKKLVAAPRCSVGNHSMEFRIFSDMTGLRTGAYGIREPDVLCEAVHSFDGSICITPALAFDPRGMRIGYGGGYYDRFLSGFTGISIGVCCDGFILDTIPADEYDQAVDMIATQSEIIRTGGFAG